MRVRRSVRRLALILGSILTSLLVVELLLHLVGYWPDLSGEAFLTRMRRVPDEHVIMIRPEFLEPSHYAMGGAAVRIVALGDSFTEGYPVAADDTYPAVLERTLREEGHDARVLDMGLGNSGPDQHLRLLKDYVLPRVDPHIVIWQFYANDIGDNVVFPTYELRDGALAPLDASQHWIYRRQRVYDAIPLPAWLKKRSAIVRALLKSWEAAWRPPMELGPEARAAAAERIRLGEREARRMAEAEGFHLVVALVWPQSAYLQALDPEPAATERVRERHGALRALLEAEVPLVDVYYADVLDAARAGDPAHAPPGLGLFVGPARDHQPSGRNHFDEEGYRRFAETIRENLPVAPR